jgi:hypothetical protein
VFLFVVKMPKFRSFEILKILDQKNSTTNDDDYADAAVVDHPGGRDSDMLFLLFGAETAPFGTENNTIIITGRIME